MRKLQFAALQLVSCALSSYFAYSSWERREEDYSGGADLLTALLWLAALNLAIQGYRAARFVLRVVCGCCSVATGAHLAALAQKAAKWVVSTVKGALAGGGAGAGGGHSCAHKARWLCYAAEEMPLCAVYALLWRSSVSGAISRGAAYSGGCILLQRHGAGAAALCLGVLLSLWKCAQAMLQLCFELVAEQLVKRFAGAQDGDGGGGGGRGEGCSFADVCVEVGHAAVHVGNLASSALYACQLLQEQAGQGGGGGGGGGDDDAPQGSSANANATTRSIAIASLVHASLHALCALASAARAYAMKRAARARAAGAGFFTSSEGEAESRLALWFRGLPLLWQHALSLLAQDAPQIALTLMALRSAGPSTRGYVSAVCSGLALAVRCTVMFVVMPYVARSGAALKAAAAAYRKAKRVGGIGSRMRLLV